MAGKVTRLSMAEARPRTVEVHGHPVNFIEAGSGPVLMLIHGMAGTCANWEAVIEPLAINHTVIAPDFPGHGASAPGGGDYSLGSLASGLRDLMLTLGHERATLVGHSLGGGVALQFTYQFPEMVERLVLVSSGGLGPDVSPILRAAALPGAELFITATAGVGSRIGSVVGRGLGLLGLRPNADVAEVTRGYASLTDPARRKAFLSTLRSVVGTEGQRVAALDKLYLAEALPLLIIWGEHDPIIPVAHAREAHAQLPASHLEIFEDAGHVPQLERPGRFIAVLERFIAETAPAEFDRDEWRARFKAAEI
ncbi:MAG TPA: alpha/beta fold hydrolase [Solirubrobacterales bacterium]|nr:alpha/beta fold hydrolase [Solirubrobacterales bacterium]